LGAAKSLLYSLTKLCNISYGKYYEKQKVDTLPTPAFFKNDHPMGLHRPILELYDRSEEIRRPRVDEEYL
jgi:hypothetical protein